MYVCLIARMRSAFFAVSAFEVVVLAGLRAVVSRFIKGHLQACRSGR